MRRRKVIARLKTLVLATLACLLLAVLVPVLLMRRAPDEPFSGYAVMASPRDLHVVTTPIRLTDAPDLTMSRGALYADGNAAAGTPISRFVLDGPVFALNASGLRATSSSFEHNLASEQFVAPLVDQFLSMGFDALIIRRGTLYITSADGSWDTLSDIQAEVTGRRKGPITSRGSFTTQGQRLAFEATVFPTPDKRAPQRWPAKFSVKGSLLEASFEGHVNVAEDLQLAGQAEVTTPSLRRLARSFGVPIPSAAGLNTAAIKGQLTWSRRTLAIENAKAAIDGNEATGTVALNLASERPLVEGTLAFSALDLTPYVESARSQSFVFDRQTASWSAFDLSFPLIRHVDADLRISAPKIAVSGLGFGRGAASISVRSGKLLADIAELELHSGTASAQITADTNELLPHYAIRGRIEGFEAGPAATALFGAPVLTGRSTLVGDLSGVGQTPAEVLRGLSGKALLSMPEGGRLALDIKALRSIAKDQDVTGWGPLAKGQTGLEQVEARATIRDGVLFTESVLARSGSAGVGAAGRVDLAEGSLNLRLMLRPNVSADQPLKPADMSSAHALSVRGPWREPLMRRDDPDAAPPTK